MCRLAILEKTDGITDIQTVPCYPQLDEEYPNSKFIYTERDIEDWIPSVKQKLCRAHDVPKEMEFKGRSRHFIRAACYGTIQYNESVFRHRWRTHQLSVMDYFKDKDNLLVMNICEGDGWEKLCPFLGKEIPGVEFPHRNARSPEWLASIEELKQARDNEDK